MRTRIDVAEREEQIVTPRAVILGFGLVASISIIATQSSYVLRSYRMVFGEMPVALLLFFGLVALVLNTILKLISPRLRLRGGELLVIFVMASVGALIPGIAMMNTFLGTIASPYYFASPENAWAEYLLEYVPKWLVPSNETGAISSFYNSLPAGERIPWGVWAGPLFWWSTLIFALLVVCTSVIAILRKQWVENERVVFPLAEVPQELISDVRGREVVPHFAKDAVFWIGFGIPFCIILWNIGGYFNPSVPRIDLRLGPGRIQASRYVPHIFTYVNLFVIGFAYLANTQVLLSVWVFHILSLVQIGVTNRLGGGLGQSDMFVGGDARAVWQCAGGMIVFVLFMLWRSRRHLRDVFAKAVSGSRDVDDSNEMMSYRMAVLGLVAGSGYLMIMMYRAGMSLDCLILFYLFAAIMFVGIVRVVAETGFIYVRPPLAAQTFVPRVLGSAYMSPTSMGAVGVSYAMVFDNRSFVMSAIANAGKLVTALKRKRSSFTWLILTSVMVSFILSSVYTIYLGYKHGALRFAVWNFPYGHLILDNVVKKMRNPFPPDVARMTMLGIGAAAVTLLSVISWRLPWWPLHPIGFVIASTEQTRRTVLSVFLVWLAKTVILRVGGVQGYRRARPFFIGLLAGYVTGVAISFAVDVIWFPGNGHDFWYLI